MKLLKNFEAFFLSAAVMAIFASFATAEVPAWRAAKTTQSAAVVFDGPMQVVVIKGQRLSAAEKARLN